MIPEGMAAALAGADGWALVVVREGVAEVQTGGSVSTDAVGPVTWDADGSVTVRPMGGRPADVRRAEVRPAAVRRAEVAGPAPGAYDFLWGSTIQGAVSDAAVPDAGMLVPDAAVPVPGGGVRGATVPDTGAEGGVAGVAVETIAIETPGASTVSATPAPAPGAAPGENRHDEPARLSVQLSTGQVFGVDRPLVFGRSPAARPGRLAEALLVAVPSPQSDISRSHLALWRDEETLLARDLGSTNGTLLRRPDRAPARVGADAPTLVRPGDIYDLGEGVTVTVGGAS
jgi:hypothetical protein